MTNQPTHGVVIPPEKVLSLAVVARRQLRDADRDDEDAEGVHVSLWPAENGDKAKLRNKEGVCVYERSKYEIMEDDPLTKKP